MILMEGRREHVCDECVILVAELSSGGQVMAYGSTGKILRVDLSAGKITDVQTSEYAPKFIGGRAVGAKIIWDEVPPTVGAFDPGKSKLLAPVDYAKLMEQLAAQEG
jgi:hypothetical protein